MSKVIYVKQLKILDDEWNIIKTGGMVTKHKNVMGKRCKITISEDYNV